MADIQIESITPSATDTTDRLMVRRGAGPLDHTIQLATPATLKGFLGLTTADVSGFNSDVRSQVEATVLAGANITITPAGSGATRTLTIAATGGGATNLAWVAGTSTVTSDTGTDATLTVADGTNPGLMTSANFTKLAGIATGATANATDAALRDRATHTGTQLASTVSDFTEAAQDAVGAMVDTSLTYVDATPLLQRAALTGAITASAGSNTTALGSFTKAQLDTAVSDGNVLYVGDVTSNATHTGEVTGATALTITDNAVINARLADMASNTIKANATAGTADPADLAVGANTVVGRVAGNIVAAQLATAQVSDDAITNPKLANVATATIKGRVTAGTGDPEDLTGTQATTLLDVFTTSLKGLAPASGGGTTNFLRADGTWAAAGGGSPITVQDEGINITTALSTLNFVGAGVTVTGGATATVTISGGGGGGLSDGNYGDVTVSGSGTVIRVNPKVKFGLPLAMGRRLQF